MNMQQPNEPAGTYQVWHRLGEQFRHVANVEAGNYMAVVVLPLFKKGTPGTERVSWLVDDARPTGYGDKIVDPLGQAYELYKPDFGGTALRETTMPVAGLERLPSPGAMGNDGDGMPTPEVWRKLQAEWAHDYGLRHMEDRSVRYEDEAERRLDHAGNAMPDFRADVFDALMTRLEAFGDEFARLAQTKQQKVLAEAFSELVGDVYTSIRYIAEATHRYGPPGGGQGEPVAAAGVPSPADLTDGNGLSHQQNQQQRQSHGIGV
jgi:hypothetical protein